jgi:hypothetical protein
MAVLFEFSPPFTMCPQSCARRDFGGNSGGGGKKFGGGGKKFRGGGKKFRGGGKVWGR